MKTLPLVAGIATAVCAIAADGPIADFQEKAPLAFEVASIKPARPLQEQAMAGKLHVGMKVDGARVDMGSMSIADMIQTAFKVKVFQVSGPEFIKSERFDIQAKLPEGAKEDQVPEMLQALLAERFKLTYHHETKEHRSFALVVAKDGPKLKESPPDPADADDPPKEEKGAMVMDTGQGKVSIKQDGRGGAIVNGGKNGISKVSMENGVMHMEMSKVKMSDFAEALSRFVGQTVVDMTDLKGNYQVTIEIGMQEMMRAAQSAGVNIPTAPPSATGDPKSADAASDPSEGSLTASLQWMGLKLESRKAPMDTIVIDHVEKAPTEN